MEQAMVSVATGVMKPLLGKLSTLLGEEYSKLKGVRKDIVFLRDELSSMHAFLEKLADVEDLDVQVKEWRNQVRELSYDIEDCINDFMLRVDRGSDIKKGFFQKNIDRLKKLGPRHDIAEQIRKLKADVDDVSMRRERYKVDEAISSCSGVVPIDPRLTALYADVKSLVGLDGPKDEIIKLLTEGETESVKKLRVVSIWGFGGLGKTTLANQVYHQLEGQFECEAFVSVSQKPNMISLLSNILLKVKGQIKGHAECEVKDIIDELRNHLRDKRYFVIIDDLWDKSHWNVVRCAFPENDNGSRVITTTRIELVARVCCDGYPEYIYKMRSLDDQDSRKLFFRRIFGSEGACPPHHKEVSAKILKKCSGLPLAIITIASILAIEQEVGWEHIPNSLDTMIGANDTLDVMMQILNLSYISLPHCLRTCFLYLGIYPEDYSIDNDDLMDRWIAEGFVSEVHGRDAKDVAESYFNELVNRSIIQIEQAFGKEVQKCRVHDMMLDLIMHKSRDENFITIIGDSRGMPGSHHKARRLCLHTKRDAIPANINVSQVRSLVTFRGSDLPFLSKFKLIQVLNLHFDMTYQNVPVDLTVICELFHLRCFKIEIEGLLHLLLPSQIRGLQHLETFEIATHCPEASFIVPSDIFCLPRLLHLVIPPNTTLPNGIGNAKSLYTLSCGGSNKISLQHIQGLAELTNLRHLHISLDESFADMIEYEDALCSSLGKIANCNLIKYLYVSYSRGNICPPPRRLQPLEMWGLWFSRLPRWTSELHNIGALDLTVRELLKDDVGILAQLPALVRLSLAVQRAPEEAPFIFSMGFPVLNLFRFWCRIMCLVFEAGAMPKLQFLVLFFGLREGEQYNVPHLVGLEHLSGLKEIGAGICGFCDVESKRRTEFALRNAIHMHPNHPRVFAYGTSSWVGYEQNMDSSN